MTEPGTSPTTPTGQPGQMMPGGSTGGSSTGHREMGAGSTGTGGLSSGSAGPGSTATEAPTTSQATVPQQMGQRSAANTMSGSEIDPDRTQDAYGTGARLLEASAGRAWGVLIF